MTNIKFFASIAFNGINDILYIARHRFVYVENFTIEIVTVTLFNAFAKGTIWKTLLDVLIFCSVNFALVISLFKFGGCRLLLIIFDVERASRIVWSLVKMCVLFLKIPNISVLFGLKVETYGSTSSSFLVCVHVLKSESLGIDLVLYALRDYCIRIVSFLQGNA